MNAQNKNESRSVNDLEAYLEASRTSLGEPPSDKQLLEFHSGRLNSEEADRILEYIAVDPEVATRFDELSSFPSLAEPGDPDYLSDNELEEHWQRFGARLRSKESTASPLLHEPDESLPAPIPPGAGIAISTRSLHAAYGVMALAALLIMILGLGYRHRGQELNQLRSQIADLGAAEPITDLYSGILTGFEPFRSKTTSIPARLPSNRQAYYLVLAQPEPPPGADISYDAEYRLEIWPTPERDDGDRGVAPIWKSEGLRFSPLGKLPVLIPGHFLEAGEYELDLIHLEGGEETLGVRYRISI